MTTRASATNLLLDTHALLWWLAGARLSAAARDAVADPASTVMVSAASVWEVEIKRALGKLRVDLSVAEAVGAEGFDGLPITLAHAEQAGRLPRHHDDPFDRMLVAQARAEGLTIVTRDPAFDAYEVAVLPC